MTSKRTVGRRIAGGFIALPNAIFRTPEFAALSGRAVKLVIEMALQFNGSNNGDLSITRVVMANRGFKSADQLVKARDELIQTGWIQQTRQGGRNICSLYALTWLAIDRCGGKLDVAHGPMPPHLWKPENPKHREARAKTLARTAEQVDPHGGTALTRNAVQGIQH